MAAEVAGLDLEAAVGLVKEVVAMAEGLAREAAEGSVKVEAAVAAEVACFDLEAVVG